MNYNPLFDHLKISHGLELNEDQQSYIVAIIDALHILERMPKDAQPKTIREWFEELPEPYRSEALENCEAQSGTDVLNSDESLMSNSLRCGFMWFATEQGNEYWRELHVKLLSEGK